MVTREQGHKLLKKLLACCEARDWLHNSRFEPESAWNQCPEADWLLWLARKLKIEKKQIVFALYECVRAISHLIPEDEERPQELLKPVERWLAGEEVSEEEREATSNAAYNILDYFGFDVLEKDSAVFACEASCYVAAYAGPLGFGVDADAAVDAVNASQRESENNLSIDFPGIIRKHIPWSMIEKHLNKLVEKEGIEL